MAYVAARKKDTVAKYIKASRRLRRAQHMFTKNTLPLHRVQWQKTKVEYELWLDNYEKLRANHVTLTYHKFCNKTGRLLSQMVRGDISKLELKHNSETSRLQGIDQTFYEFYSTLYSTCQYDEKLAKQFLDRVHLPTLLQVQLEVLNRPIELDEITSP